MSNIRTKYVISKGLRHDVIFEIDRDHGPEQWTISIKSTPQTSCTILKFKQWQQGREYVNGLLERIR